MTDAAPAAHPQAAPARPGAQPARELADTVELLGLVAHLQHVAFGRLAEDARVAPSTGQQLELSRLAAAAVGRRDRVLERVVELGGDPERCLGAYARLLEDFDSRTQPSTWWERLLRSYVADGVSDDFCRIAAAAVDPESRVLLLEVLDDAEHANLAVGELEAAGAHDEVLTSRLALWGRRLVGEALGVVQQAMTAHPGLGRLVTRRGAAEAGAGPQGEGIEGDGIAVDGIAGAGTAADGATDLADPTGAPVPEPAEEPVAPGKLFGELTAEHTRRMSRLGLTA